MIRFIVIVIVSGLLAGCASDPLRDVPRLSETDVSDSEIQAALRGEPDVEAEAVVPVAEPQRRGLLGRLFGGDATPSQTDDSLPTTATDAAPVAEEAETELDTATAADASAAPTLPATAAAPRRGLLGFLSRAAKSAQAEDGVEVAAVPPSTQNDAVPAATAKGPKPGAPDYQIVPMGTVLPYGVLARVCDVPTRQLGSRVERYPDTRAVFTLYDSQPGTTTPHTFYVTGFKDGCARQFTAALALFGSPQTHEQLRYGLPSKVQPYSSTDAAYETLKSRVCRVGKGKPCGSSMSRLARNTVFVSVYERFGSNPVWKTILLHDGEVVQTDIRGN
jgi:hypothetical protein